ncbi:hypothetical protein GQ44DRAFT_777625 [Phaeosphaeriaceae sp. PMI808]|nr:hypothetical protein GQ44DRAFT_777625 [Phaeosphaeriaceae sp. PMI808]
MALVGDGQPLTRLQVKRGGGLQFASETVEELTETEELVEVVIDVMEVLVAWYDEDVIDVSEEGLLIDDAAMELVVCDNENTIVDVEIVVDDKDARIELIVCRIWLRLSIEATEDATVALIELELVNELSLELEGKFSIRLDEATDLEILES